MTTAIFGESIEHADWIVIERTGDVYKLGGISQKDGKPRGFIVRKHQHTHNEQVLSRLRECVQFLERTGSMETA